MLEVFWSILDATEGDESGRRQKRLKSVVELPNLYGLIFYFGAANAIIFVRCFSNQTTT